MSGFGERLNQRESVTQKGRSAQDGTRRREDTAVQIRKQEKEAQLAHRRRTDEEQAAIGGGDGMMDGNASSVPSDHIQNLCQGLLTDDPQVLFNTTQQFRKLLSIEHNPPIQDVIQCGVVPKFVEFLKEINRPDLQFEAAWVLTNIASGNAEQTRCVVEHGALPIFVQLLLSPNDDVREQAVWALGNIAGDSPNFRDLVLQSGGLEPVMNVIRSAEKMSIIRNATWTLSNLCRGKPQPPLQWVVPALGTLAQLIHSTDVEALTDACWALTYLSDGSEEHINAVLNANVLRRLVELLGHPDAKVQTPALRALGNIVTGNDTQTQTVLENGALQAFGPLLSHSKKAIRKECCWAISNVTAGNQQQIQEVINAGLLAPVIQLLEQGDFDIKKEAAWAVSNATMGGNPQQIEYLITNGCLRPLIDLLTVSDTKILVLVLDTLDNLLRVGKNQQEQNGLPDNPVAVLVEQNEALPKIEELQENTSEEVYQKAAKLLETHFEIQEDEVADGQNQFQFGAAAPQGGFNFGQAMG
jgi:hypothetical protein